MFFLTGKKPVFSFSYQGKHIYAKYTPPIRLQEAIETKLPGSTLSLLVRHFLQWAMLTLISHLKKKKMEKLCSSLNSFYIQTYVPSTCLYFDNFFVFLPSTMSSWTVLLSIINMQQYFNQWYNLIFDGSVPKWTIITNKWCITCKFVINYARFKLSCMNLIFF